MRIRVALDETTTVGIHTLNFRHYAWKPADDIPPAFALHFITLISLRMPAAQHPKYA